jgi:IMP dehydrogenase
VAVQAARVAAVKAFRNGFLAQPACMRPDQPISDLDALVDARGISGVPITATGSIGGTLLGLVEAKDVVRPHTRWTMRGLCTYLD